MPRVLVLGADGMLGSMLTRVLTAEPDIELSSTTRRGGAASRRFDVTADPLGRLLDDERADWIVNAIGMIKPRIDERDPGSIENAIAVNARFPHRLAAESAERGIRVIQIATDGVFSGRDGPYDETAPHDALDVYGKAKSLGESPAPNMIHLRCSIIGPETARARSFLGWAVSAPHQATLDGYSDQRWNGVTTLQFAKVCAAVIAGAPAPALQHLIPADSVTKAELLELVLSAFGREDVSVRHMASGHAADRTLATRDTAANEHLWRAAGYETVPTIAELVSELAAAGAKRPIVAS